MTRKAVFAVLAAVFAVCTCREARTVPHVERWGIYALDLASGDMELMYSSADQIGFLSLDPAGARFALASRSSGAGDESHELCTVAVDGTGFRRLTENGWMDVYPRWSPDGSQLAFLSWPDSTLDVYVMDADGNNCRLLFDSGGHDGDIDWVSEMIVFTAGSRIWRMKPDGTDPVVVTDPPRAGEWGSAPLPFGDYDPRVSPDGTRIVFERLVGDSSPHGNYDIYVVNADGTGEQALTQTGYTQGMTCWSHDGGRLVYMVSAVGTDGRYDIYTMNADGTGAGDVTPAYFPSGFLCHDPVFAPGDRRVYFIGEWWQ
jgi:Tol biopolymer transport system component